MNAAVVALGKRIKERRTKLGITRRALAKTLNFSYQLLCDWEHGRREPTIRSIVVLMKEIHLTKQDLLQCYAKENRDARIDN